jgi:uncharacterized spore protein YtfJ
VDKGVRRLIDAVAGARLCYGEPVREGERTVIPVSRVRVAGGWGFGRSDQAKGAVQPGSGGGGGGSLDAHPAGFIELGPEGARFHEIPDPERTQRLVRAGAAALTTVLAGVAGVRGMRGLARRRPAGLLGRGR